MEEEKKIAVTESEKETVDFSSLPEGVVAYILSLTTPPDVCRSSAVSQTFFAAAQSDIVWDRFLPSDWLDFASLSEPRDVSFDPASSSKKDVFFALCDHPLLIDDSKRSFALDRWSGKKCLMLGARDLSIAWGDSPLNFWIWKSYPNSRFPEVAELRNVWWFEIRGKMRSSMLSPATTYAAYFVFKMKDNSYYGFNIDPVDATVGIVAGERYTKSVCLDPYLNESRRRTQHMPRFNNYESENMFVLPQPRERSDGWFEMELGEFENEDGGDEVEIVLMEVKGSSSKTGLVVHGIEIKPKTRPA